jgi:hypothetical protein
MRFQSRISAEMRNKATSLLQKPMWLALATAGLLAAPGSAHAVKFLNIDFQPSINDPLVTTNTYTVDYSGAAAALGAGTAWNSLVANNPSPAAFIGEPGYYDDVAAAPATYMNLVDSTGAATPIDIGFTAGGTFAVNETSPNYPNNIASDALGLMRDYLIAFQGGGQGGARTVTISSLVPNEPLILYLYGEGDNNSNDRQTTFNANGVIGSTSGDAPPDAPLTEGSDYVRLTGVTADASGVLTITYSANGVPEGPFNGLQLMYELAVGIPGDTDGDNDVDMVDYNNIKNNFRNSGLLTRMQGDIAGPNSNSVGDGVVDFHDFIAWQQHFPTPGPAAGSGGLAAVPEPGTLFLALAAAGLFFAVRHRIND